MNIAIIPARGESKRIPRKNIKLFHGIPVIAYAIKTARESGVFQDIYVSTDDLEISTIASSYGANVLPLRSKELSDDKATTLEVMKDTVLRLDEKLPLLDNVCCIYPVTPLLAPIALVNGLQILENEKMDYVLSAVRVSEPPHRTFMLDDFNVIKMLFPEYIETRTQDLEPTYQDAGQFYWGKKNSWKSGFPILSSNTTILELPFGSVVDVDTLTDWEHAEELFQQKKITRNGA
jgi:N-acylneuraminate cytidylyltransferase